jgi:hypothetical protein
MTGTITLSDGGQNYIEFDLVCGVIQEVRPARLSGWRGTKALNKAYMIGGRLIISLQWDEYDFPLPYPITAIKYEELAGGEWLRANMSKEKKLYACPRGGEDKMLYDVDCKGLPFYFPCVNRAAVAASEALLNHEKIPAVLLEDVDGVMLFDEIKPGRPETIADLGNWFMAIYNNYIVDYGIITHEATHAWAFDKWGQYAPPYDTAYTEVIRFSGEEPITEYAKTNYAEDLAEGVRYYVFNPTRMKNKCPLRYAIIERMMTDPDYYG